MTVAKETGTTGQGPPKGLHFLIQSSSLKQRRLVFRDLEAYFRAEGNVPEAAVKGVCRLLALTLPRYHDSESRALVRRFVKFICDVGGVSGFKQVATALADVAASYTNSGNMSASVARAPLAALNWTVSVIDSSVPRDQVPPECYSSLHDSQAKLYACVVSSVDAGLIKRAQKALGGAWKRRPDELSRLHSTAPFWSRSLSGLVFGSFALSQMQQQADPEPEQMEKLKESLLSSFVDLVVSSKSPVTPSAVSPGCAFLLASVTSQEVFSRSLLPPLLKAILRNPEVVMGTLGTVLGTLTIDLSPYALQIGKPVAASLNSKLDQTREEAWGCLRVLASACSEGEAVKGLFLFLEKVYHGTSDVGKLLGPPQKHSTLKALGSLSTALIPSSAFCALGDSVVGAFSKILENEVHEGSLTLALQMLSLWGQRMTVEVPTSMTKLLLKGPKLKSSTPVVRCEYLRLMDAVFDTSSLFPEAEPLIPQLGQAVDKGAQAGAQMFVVTEALLSCTLLERLAAALPAADAQAASCRKLSDSPKAPFYAEKYLLQAPSYAFPHVVGLIETILARGSGSAEALAPPLALALCLSAPGKCARASSRLLRIVSLSDGAAVLPLCRALANLLLQHKVSAASEAPSSGGDEAACSLRLGSWFGAVQLLAQALKSLMKERRAQAALELLAALHDPLVAPLFMPCPWTRFLAWMDLLPQELLEGQEEALLDFVRLRFDGSLAHRSALSTLTSLFSAWAVPVVLGELSRGLRDPQVALVTQEEVTVWRAPEGTLVDTSVLDSAVEESAASVKNMKRESKAYSYKEQLAEIELRKELERKRREANPNQELTPKQKEAKAAQLAKERAIRQRVEEIHGPFHLCVERIRAVLRPFSRFAGAKERRRGLYVSTDDVQARCLLLSHLHDLCPLLLSLLPLPLPCEDAAGVWRALAPVLLSGREDRLFGEAVCSATLRLHVSPASYAHCLPPDWLREDLRSLCIRLIGQLSRKPRPVPTFSYCYWFLDAVCRGRGGVSLTEEELKTVLKILLSHMGLRPPPEDNRPLFLPLAPSLSLAVDIVQADTSSALLANQATHQIHAVADALLDSAPSAAEGAEIPRLLLQGLTNGNKAVREACLKALVSLLPRLLSPPSAAGAGEVNGCPEAPPEAVDLRRRLLLARFDPQEDIANDANDAWTRHHLRADQHYILLVIDDLTHPEAVVRSSAAQALASLLEEWPDSLPDTLQVILDKFVQHKKLIPAVLDDFGRQVAPPLDPWEPRSGLASALTAMAPQMRPESVLHVMEFLVRQGFADRNTQVQTQMLDAGMAMLETHGKAMVGDLLPLFQALLDGTPSSADADFIRQSLVLLMGSLAKYLSEGDPRVQPIVAKLIEALSTPSQQVQEAVANCLPPLVSTSAVKQSSAQLVHDLMHCLLESENYGDRRGAAYGLAGFVKGLGILSLKKMDIISQLTEAISNKANPRHREGALFGIELLSTMLGRLFEPYVVVLLPHLLVCFGDSNQYVRQAADECAKAVMGKLSVHGVKLIMPLLLEALNDDSWRTKAGSVELLGSMAYCAPKQLSSCLPAIVPKLIEVLSDSHPKVQRSGSQALKLIGSVIRNPEIQAIVSILIQALEDPAHKTSSCLATLLETKFVHFIDAPSLALIMPIVQRAFQDRSTETRKMAAQIIGNMYSLTDQKDLTPYLPNILPGLKGSLLDPLPEVRSASARALGAMVKGLGEGSYSDLLPWLMNTLQSEGSSVDRSGAAQGLAEVVGGLGPEKLHKIMPDLINTASDPNLLPHQKDGYIMLFIYMPHVFGDDFLPFIGMIVDPILQALADETEYVRDTALKAGQRIVNLYADSAIQLLLPELEKGLFHDNWRIRYSSIQLIGDLLYKISGVSGKMTTETASEDDNFGTEQSHKAIMRSLGSERRNRVLAGLYMGRSDVSLMVRQAALHVWKIVVTNTPRTLREILPTLFNLLLGCLASKSYDKRQVAARTLGDLVRKLGERVLPEIIPILERGLDTGGPNERQGVCIGLSEIINSTSREMVLAFVSSLVPTVRQALCDPLPEVREAAAMTFDALHSVVGSKALDDILNPMIDQLEHPELAEDTLDGLRQIMSVKSKVVLPYLVPQLTKGPVNTRALAVLASVAGDALTRHLAKILPALLESLEQALDTEREAQELQYCQDVVLSITDELGVRHFIEEMLENCKSDRDHTLPAVLLLSYFCGVSKMDYQAYVPALLRGFIHLFTEDNKRVLHTAWEGLSAVIKSQDSKALLERVGDVRQAVRYAKADLKPDQTLMPGFCLPKGITPLLPVFREPILSGDGDQKELSCLALGEVIRLTSGDALKPSVIHITGPLIRILGERYNYSVKIAALDALALLLEKVGPQLKPFLPQLQTTFAKSLNDPHRQTRLRAAYALTKLIPIHAKIEALFTDLHNGVKNADDVSVRDTFLFALRLVLGPAGEKLTPSNRRQMLGTLVSLLSNVEDTTRLAAAGCVGIMVQWLREDELHSFLADTLLHDDLSRDWLLRHGCAAALAVTLKERSSATVTLEFSEAKVTKCLQNYILSDRAQIVQSGIRGCGYLLRHCLREDRDPPLQILTAFARSINHSSNEVKTLVASFSAFLARSVAPPSSAKLLPPPYLRALVPALVNGTKEKNTIVRSSSESALVEVLWLRHGDDLQKECLETLEEGAREALSDVIVKVLRRVANQPEGKEEELDETVLT